MVIIGGALFNYASLVLPALALLTLVADANNLDDFLLVKILETSARDHIIVVLLCEQKARFLQPLAVEGIRVLEDLAY